MQHEANAGTITGTEALKRRAQRGLGCLRESSDGEGLVLEYSQGLSMATV